MQGPITIEELLAAPAINHASLTQLRQRRSIAVGDSVVLTFESRTTVLATLQAIMINEGMDAPEALQAECDVYNALIPRGGLGAVVALRDLAAVTALAGLETGLFLAVDTHRTAAQFFAPLTLGQHVGFVIDEDFRTRFAAATVDATVLVEVPGCRLTAAIPMALRRTLLEDLA